MDNPLRTLARKALRAVAGQWPDYSRLIPVHDITTWVIKWEMEELKAIARNLHIKTAHPFWRPFAQHQSIFLGSQFFLLADSWFAMPHRIGTAYFHGKPGTGYPEFDLLFERVKRNHHKIDRIQVSHSEMHDVVLETGIDAAKVFRIPIGINLDYFPRKNPDTARQVRQRLNIPQSAVVIGSFQKDGNGHGEGNEPKLIKGPDIFLQTVQGLKAKIPEIHVLLTGPARGYVKQGLARHHIPFTHLHLNKYPEIGQLYQALDLYLVTSRQEGGPKAILESMAAGIPLVTTRVGQAMDLVRHEENGWMVPSEDIEGLTHWAEKALTSPADVLPVLDRARKTAEENSYPQLTEQWRRLMAGFVQSKQ